MKEKTIEIIKKIFVIVFCIILTYCFLRVGSPLENNMQIINVLISFSTIIVIIISIKKKKEIKFTKMEIAILILIATCFIPIIFNTQSSLNSTLNSIFKYISAFNIFIIVKSILNIDKKYINYIIVTIIVASVLLTIFGIDMMNANLFQGFYNFVDKINVSHASEVRMDSLYEYPNTFAMFLAIALILTIGRLKDNIKNKTKKDIIFNILYLVAICFQIYGIIMSGSRMTLLILLFISIIWAFLERKKYFNKTTISIIVIIVDLIVLFVILCFNIETKLVLFNETKQEQSKYVKEISNIEPNTQYNFKFDIYSYNNTDETDKFKIIIKEMDNNFNVMNEKMLKIDSFDGIKNIDIKTKQNTKIIKIIFQSIKTQEGKTYFEVRNVLMNGKKLKMNYFLIPVNIADRVVDINTYSIIDRYRMIVDGIKIAKDNIFTGIGGDGWLYKYKTITDYDHSATQMHCYIIDIFIQNGIFGLIAVIGLFSILIYKIIKIIKEKNIKLYPIIFAVIFGLLHSLLDFDMNFYSILMLMFILFAIIDNEVKEKEIVIKKGKLIIRIITLMIVTIIFIINIGSYISYKMDKNINEDEQKVTTDNWQQKLQQSKEKLILEPYNYMNEIERLQIYIIAKKTNLSEEDYKKYTMESIDILNTLVKREKGRNLEKNYYNLIVDYIELMNNSNIEEILSKIDVIIENLKIDITNEYYLIDMYESIVEELENKNIELKSDVIDKKCNQIYEENMMKREMENEE